MLYRKKYIGTLFVAPATLLLFFLTIFPLIYSFYISLFNIRGWDLSTASFAGLYNYFKVMTDPIFLRAFLFTSYYTLASLLIELSIGTFLAFFVYEITERKSRTTKIISIFILIPILMPGVATAMISSLMLRDLIGVIPKSIL